ncbi:hypothetical protein DPEC_G00335140 [Dallia pectoralis]|uniref:Uncharacterized protein n=1 Tax=Dallia pectoralis TaxID=75939 RepID=A0ACC2F7A1_DALPE|nr:hypothetical protein DPEC_G00335140 [Dallia pectoralis]
MLGVEQWSVVLIGGRWKRGDMLASSGHLVVTCFVTWQIRQQKRNYSPDRIKAWIRFVLLSGEFIPPSSFHDFPLLTSRFASPLPLKRQVMPPALLSPFSPQTLPAHDFSDA